MPSNQRKSLPHPPPNTFPPPSSVYSQQGSTASLPVSQVSPAIPNHPAATQAAANSGHPRPTSSAFFRPMQSYSAAAVNRFAGYNDNDNSLGEYGDSNPSQGQQLGVGKMGEKKSSKKKTKVTKNSCLKVVPPEQMSELTKLGLYMSGTTPEQMYKRALEDKEKRARRRGWKKAKRDAASAVEDAGERVDDE